MRRIPQGQSWEDTPDATRQAALLNRARRVLDESCERSFIDNAGDALTGTTQSDERLYLLAWAEWHQESGMSYVARSWAEHWRKLGAHKSLVNAWDTRSHAHAAQAQTARRVMRAHYKRLLKARAAQEHVVRLRARGGGQ